MGTKHLWNAPDIVPSLTFSDLPGAVVWFERVFGFRERKEARLSWPGGGMTWMEAGSGLLSITMPDEQFELRPSAAGLMIKVYVDDVDRHFARAKTEGAEIVMEPKDGFWGGRIYRVRDCEGHLWEISQRGRDLAADRWQMPPGLTRGVTK